ncbi:MAG: SUF system Fe-S cluster assembly regulator [Magnetococcus sp. THC-1_WYH]
MLTDYGLLILTRMASSPEEWFSATDIATALAMPIHTVAKVLKTMHQGGFLESRRGKRGGYRLAKLPSEISVRAIFEAFEGRLHVTECSISSDPCQFSSKCPMVQHWRVVTDVIRRTLDDISLEFLLQPEPAGWVGFVGRSSNLER